MIDFLVPLVAALLAGTLNTLAGGGTFLTFPALVLAGVPPVAANATSAVAVFPGYFGGALGFKRELKRFSGRQIGLLVCVTIIGAAIGSALLMVSSNRLFSMIVPLLLLVATLAFTFGESIQKLAGRSQGLLRPFGIVGILLVSIYGGYFNGGLGIVLLALFALWGLTDIHAMNGLKNGQSFVLSAVSVVIFALAGLVVWHHALPMMVAAYVGGYLGAPLARRLPWRVVRGIVTGVGVVMTLVFGVRALA